MINKKFIPSEELTVKLVDAMSHGTVTLNELRGRKPKVIRADEYIGLQNCN